ncbi:radical SAM protein [Microbispora sp. NPDC049633]|uniref:radical SAM protein n=1 Tax=Microbispora sp. NPDC049633 TaxID=3154355 RepID=UPI003437E9AF
MPTETAGGRIVPDYLLLKLASRCNINCDYCYWFRDSSVYERPPLLTEEAERALLRRLAEHITEYKLRRFSILFHGGEPLLFGKRRSTALFEALRELEYDTGIQLKLSMTTNGLLLDDEWARILCENEIHVTISIDGPPQVHDLRRRDFRGFGTHAAVLRAFDVMRRHGVSPGALAVCDPASDPAAVLHYFLGDLEADVDILVPDATHEDTPASIAPFYCGLFDVWYDEYADRGVTVRFLSSLVKGLLGMSSRSESIGYGQITTMTMLTDGGLEALDVLRTSRQAITKSALNVIHDPLVAINDDPMWQEIRHASTNLADVCRRCAYRFACGGGHIASRWSPDRRYDNPSVYCDDYKVILGHIWRRMGPDLHVQLKDHSRVPLLEVIR